jgi:hypothetical protein
MIPIENKEYKIERLDFSRLKDLETLHEAVYKYAPPKNYFQKKYDTDYTGVNYLGYIAYNKENIPIAYYGVMPCFIQYKNEIILSAQSGDTMTHPIHRYKGMFVELSKMTFDLCKAAGIKIIFGFPNQNSYHGAIHKLGWIMTDQMESFIIPVNTLSFQSYSERFKLTKHFYKQYAKYTLRKYFVSHQGLRNSVITEGFGGVYRSEEYLQYKTYSDTQVIKIGTAKAWIKITNHFIIGDLETEDPDFDKVINAIKKNAQSLGISKIMFQSSPGTRLHNLFAKRFKSSPSFPVLFQNFGADIPLNEIKFTFADIDIF